MTSLKACLRCITDFITKDFQQTQHVKEKTFTEKEQLKPIFCTFPWNKLKDTKKNYQETKSDIDDTIMKHKTDKQFFC